MHYGKTHIAINPPRDPLQTHLLHCSRHFLTQFWKSSLMVLQDVITNMVNAAVACRPTERQAWKHQVCPRPSYSFPDQALRNLCLFLKAKTTRQGKHSELTQDTEEATTAQLETLGKQHFQTHQLGTCTNPQQPRPQTTSMWPQHSVAHANWPHRGCIWLQYNSLCPEGKILHPEKAPIRARPLGSHEETALSHRQKGQTHQAS